MENNQTEHLPDVGKMMSSIDFYAYSHRNLLIELENKKISIGEYAVKHGELFLQAKEKHKQEIIDAWIATDNVLQREMAEQYYNKIFKKIKQ